MPQIEGFSHVSLSVTDQQRSARWYEEVFGFVTFDKLDEPDYAESVLLHPQRRHPLRPAAPRQPRHPFDPARTGGDHLAFQVASRDELDRGTDRLAELGVTHSPVADRGYGSVLCLRDPDGIQLEHFWREGHP